MAPIQNTHVCEYCGTTQGLRIVWDGRPMGRPIACICSDCFNGSDTGPGFDDLPLLADDLERAPHIARINDLSLCLNNPDGATRDVMASRLVDGLPAYWYRGQGSAASRIVSQIDDDSLITVMVGYIDRENEKLRQGLTKATDIDATLDGIIPLNQPAIEELSLLYRLQSTFRDDLADRERKAIFDPFVIDGMDMATRAIWQTRYEACQQRWADRRDEEYEARNAALPDAQSAVLDLAKVAVAIASDADARAAVEGEQVAEVA